MSATAAKTWRQNKKVLTGKLVKKTRRMIPIGYYSALKNEILGSIVMGGTQVVEASGSGAR